MEDAIRCLTLSEQGAKKYLKLAKASPSGHRFQPGIEWEVLHTDAVVLLGLTHALGYDIPLRRVVVSFVG